MNNSINRRGDISHLLGLDTSGVFGILLAIFWTSANLVYFARGVVSAVFGSEVASFFIPFIYIVFGLLSLPFIARRIRLYDVFVFMLIIAYFFACYSLYPFNIPYLDSVKEVFLFYCLPGLFVGLALDYGKCERVIYVASFAAVLLTAFSTLLGGGKVGDGGIEDMNRSYSMLAPVIVMTWRFFTYRKPVDLLVLMIGFVLIFALGARGPLAIYAIFIILYFLIFRKYKHPFWARTGLVVLMICVLLFLNPILNMLGSMAAGIGLSNRVSEFAVSGDLLEFRGRDIIAANVLYRTVNGPFWGNGFCADRGYSDFFDTDTYAHNIALELWAEFGFLGGSIILIFILISFFKAIRKSKDENEKMFVLIMFVSGFCSLLVSGTYLWKDMFFIALGLFVSISRRKITI